MIEGDHACGWDEREMQRNFGVERMRLDAKNEKVPIATRVCFFKPLPGHELLRMSVGGKTM